VTAHLTLIADHVENPANTRTLCHAAAMFNAACALYGAACPDETPAVPSIVREELAAYRPLVACDNSPGAAELYGYRLPAGSRPAIVVGNERRGVSPEVRRLTTAVVEIPMVSRRVNTLNVAAAGAVVLYYLSRPPGSRLQRRASPDRRRPELLLLGAADHVELGSAIRSAGALGWRSLFVEDRAGVWFGASHAVQTEGRAAARRAKNPIKLVPAAATQRYGFEEVVVITTGTHGTPLHHAHLAGGDRQLVVIPDESSVNGELEDWERLGRHVRLVRLDLPTTAFVYHYRLLATITLAEVARQVGQRLTAPGGGRGGLRYASELTVTGVLPGETVFLDELSGY
jgi:tRNA G18 (ribose-2'-O)-methylase SpoU